MFQHDTADYTGQSENFVRVPNCTRKIIQGANNTIQHIAELDPTIGGAVRYAVIRKGFSGIKGIYSSDCK